MLNLVTAGVTFVHQAFVLILFVRRVLYFKHLIKLTVIKLNVEGLTALLESENVFTGLENNLDWLLERDSINAEPGNNSLIAAHD